MEKLQPGLPFNKGLAGPCLCPVSMSSLTWSVFAVVLHFHMTRPGLIAHRLLLTYRAPSTGVGLDVSVAVVTVNSLLP